MSDELKGSTPNQVIDDFYLELATIQVASTESRIDGYSSGFRLVIHPRADPAPPSDPLTTVAYESGMFRETSDIAMNHWQELPSNVLRYAVVEDAVLHARSLCEIFLCSGQEDSISLKCLFSDFNTNIEKYTGLRTAQKALQREYCQNNGRPCSYDTLFNTRVMHPTTFRGQYGLYREPLSRLRPKLLAIVDELADLDPSFRQLLRAQVPPQE